MIDRNPFRGMTITKRKRQLAVTSTGPSKDTSKTETARAPLWAELRFTLNTKHQTNLFGAVWANLGFQDCKGDIWCKLMCTGSALFIVGRRGEPHEIG